MVSAVSLAIGSLLLSWSGHQALFASLLWFGLILVVLTIGIAAVAWWRRTHWRGEITPAAGLTLDDLRRHYQEGRITSEEYESLRKTVLNVVRTDTPK
jgi:hypothetical protein